MTKEADGTLTLTLENGEVLGGFDQVLVAAGREPILDKLGLDSAGVKTDRGYIKVRNQSFSCFFRQTGERYYLSEYDFPFGT